ncbi:MAG: DsrE family protein [Chloroflexi bacterium]|nr:DsrE family protein [Chloroflexota bacterium]MBI5051814.1 DsrE family protein [Chloroflexota bacterium]MBI5082201.1 DsrE family protein [Chloroflexota bacterium]MBI5349594.1 DsrE family protein [Chloroflexota bacterium]
MTEPTKKKYLFIINEGPYGNERPYNALRLALNLVKRPEASVRVFMTGDGVLCARKGQKTPDGYYNLERMIKSLAQRGEVAT